MQIQNIDSGAGSLNVEGKVYTGKDGVFEVPDEVAASLVNFPHWRAYDGEPWPFPKTEDDLEAERIAAIAKQVVAEMKSEPKPHPKRK